MPASFHEVPDVQKLFHVRNRDASAVRLYAPEFLRALRSDSEYWKFRMAVQFHDLGHFSTDWKARYLLWCSSIESIYTSHNREHQGTLIATSRIRWFLGEDTSIYSPGDLPRFLPVPDITVGEIVSDLYTVRNFLAHGDRVPDVFFNEYPRRGVNGGVCRIEVLLEAASFIIRTSLLKILHDRLLPHFINADSGDTFFEAQGLTNAALRAIR